MLVVITCGPVVLPMFWGEYPKGIPLCFIMQKGKWEVDHRDVQGQGDWLVFH